MKYLKPRRDRCEALEVKYNKILINWKQIFFITQIIKIKKHVSANTVSHLQSTPFKMVQKINNNIVTQTKQYNQSIE